MGIFNTILNKLGFGHDDATPAAAPAPAPAAPADAAPAAAPAPVAPVAMSEVDVVSKLDGLAAASSQELNWRESIVDLMKLLGIDSSYDERKKLAAELNCPANLMDDSAQMNMWLHKTVLQQVAANGGNVPADLLG
ncbi:DUF3597 domain-containing protein [Aquirhabdus parva]|uniref:DUF3597 domain-containing protein n=1 Tax=Aquirhabdus parva TaxID=2283318 RepID=A0A345P9R6_9GAMM|nr:DUF3597 domain-containing protein [Aquirhabdus parva]AXI04025.1 DUF3597 domain-containing protein [Aquirhabdus parva]